MPDGSTARQEGGVLMTVTPAPAADVNLGTVEGGVAVDQGGYGATGTVETVVAEASPSIPADLGSVMQEGTILGHTDGKQYVVRDGAWAYHGETPTAEVDLGTVQGGATVDQGGYGATGTVETVVAGPRRLADHEPTGVTIRNDDGSYENLTCARYREVFKEDYNDVLARERKAAEIAKARPVSLSQMSGVALGENVSNPEAVLASIEASHKSADQMIAMLTASSDVEQMESKMQEARAG